MEDAMKQMLSRDLTSISSNRRSILLLPLIILMRFRSCALSYQGTDCCRFWLHARYSLAYEHILTNGHTHTHWHTCTHISMPRVVLPGVHGVNNGKSKRHKRAWFGGKTGHLTFQVEQTTTSGIQAALRVQQSESSVMYSGSDHAVTGTTIHALLLLVDHVDPGVRKYALMKLCDHLPIWRVPVDPKFAPNQKVLWSDVVMEDMPHADDIVATVKQRQQSDTQADVRDAAQVHVLHTSINILAAFTCLSARSYEILIFLEIPRHC